jgi:hypothetical protein
MHAVVRDPTNKALFGSSKDLWKCIRTPPGYNSAWGIGVKRCSVRRQDPRELPWNIRQGRIWYLWIRKFLGYGESTTALTVTVIGRPNNQNLSACTREAPSSSRGLGELPGTSLALPQQVFTPTICSLREVQIEPNRALAKASSSAAIAPNTLTCHPIEGPIDGSVTGATNPGLNSGLFDEWDCRLCDCRRA